MTPHFTDKELSCPHCGILPSQEAQDALERVRVRVGHPLRVSSGLRCPAYNQQVSSTGPNGPHTKGAFDLAISGERALQLVIAAVQEGATGIGVKQHGPHEKRFIHIDFLPNADGQPRPTVWSYP